MKIEAFNSAGEVVKLIGEMPVSAQVGQVFTYVNGVLGDTFDPNDGSLQISLEGIYTIGQPDTVLVTNLYWDGSNDGGQTVAQGLYYIKFTVSNGYGQVETTVKEINILTAEEYVKLKIYNSAGELVRTIESSNIPGTSISLGVSDVVLVGKGSSDVQVEYAPGQVIIWDGNNSDGRTVDSGVYEMKVEISTSDGYKVVASKSVTVLNAGKAGVISEEKVYPNPLVIAGGAIGKATIAWTPTGTGRMTISIYNTAGELIRKTETGLLPSVFEWDLKTVSGQPVTSGIYVVVLQAKKDTGETDNKILKLSVTKKF